MELKDFQRIVRTVERTPGWRIRVPRGKGGGHALLYPPDGSAQHPCSCSSDRRARANAYAFLARHGVRI